MKKVSRFKTCYNIITFIPVSALTVYAYMCLFKLTVWRYMCIVVVLTVNAAKLNALTKTGKSIVYF